MRVEVVARPGGPSSRTIPRDSSRSTSSWSLARHSVYANGFRGRLKNVGVRDIMTQARSPWQNGHVERLIGPIRRECLDHVIVFNEGHLMQVMGEYVRYDNESRAHLGLNKASHERRAVEPPSAGPIKSRPEVGGVHHRCHREAAWTALAAFLGGKGPISGSFEECSPACGDILLRLEARPLSSRSRASPMIHLERSVWRTLAWLFAVTYALQVTAIVRGGMESPEFKLWVGATMYLPALFTLIHVRRSGEGWRSLPWRAGPIRYLLLAATLPAWIVLFGLTVFEGTGFGFQPSVYLNEAGQLGTDLPLLLKSEWMGRLQFAASLLITGVMISLATSLTTVGEEIGWRGFLQSKLLERNRRLPSVVFLGLIWAAWHLPLILAGFNYPEAPVLGALVYFPLAAVGVSGWLAWLTLRSKSLWPAVLFHAGINSVGALLFEVDFEERYHLGQLAISIGLLVSGLTMLRWAPTGSPAAASPEAPALVHRSGS